MERLSIPTFTFATKTYCLLTKPGIIFGNIVTTAGGFLLASRGHIDLWLFVATLVGLTCVIASGCVFNNYIDRDADKKMARTKNRAFAQEAVSVRPALLFGALLGVVGVLCLAFFVNLLSLVIAVVGFIVYVALYSFSKYYSVHGTLIGSVAGAIPPVVGYCGASNTLDLGALIFFLIIVAWQMPHFFSIAIFRLEDYEKASIPVLPLKKGIWRTKIQMILYIVVFGVIASMLTVFHYVGYGYLIVSMLLTLAWLILCVRGLTARNDKVWARQMFVCSLVVVMGLCLAIPFSVNHFSAS